MPGKIFISYSKKEPEPTRALAEFLSVSGYSVWWDTNLTSGETFRKVIDRELDEANAVIVIWTTPAIASDWVVAEADHAQREGKLITLRTSGIQPWQIPKPYNTLQSDLVTDNAAVLKAVERLAGKPKPPPLVPPAPVPPLSEQGVKEAIALEHWHAVRDAASPAPLREFLARFAGSQCAPLAASRLTQMAAAAWKAVDKTSEPAITGFIAAWPESPDQSSARALLARIGDAKSEQAKQLLAKQQAREQADRGRAERALQQRLLKEERDKAKSAARDAADTAEGWRSSPLQSAAITAACAAVFGFAVTFLPNDLRYPLGTSLPLDFGVLPYAVGLGLGVWIACKSRFMHLATLTVAFAATIWLSGWLTSELIGRQSISQPEYWLLRAAIVAARTIVYFGALAVVIGEFRKWKYIWMTSLAAFAFALANYQTISWFVSTGIDRNLMNLATALLSQSTAAFVGYGLAKTRAPV